MANSSERMPPDLHKQPTHPGHKPLPTKPSPFPTHIGPYRIEGELTKGGMSHLYLAIHPETHDPLVVKVLSPQFVAHPEMKTHFLREAKIISLADHPNIVKVYGNGEWEGGVYIALEFIQGLSLRQFILQHTLSLKRALEVVLQITEALQHLHLHGVIHRDLKPENILITAEGGIKVIDFGIAQLQGNREEQAHPSTGGVIGTPVYMAPEQRKDPHSVTLATDQYALAIITYELVSGRLSHGELHISLMPKGLQRILAKALQPNPDARYDSIKAFATDLTDYLQSPAIERDQLGRGYAQDLATHLRSAQETLLPARPPAWRHVEIGLSLHRLELSGVLYDFLELNEGRYGIFISEPSATGVEGILHMAMLGGMIRALSASIDQSEVFISTLNQLVIDHPIDEIFTLNYLILDPAAKQLHYLSCGYGPLWLVRSGQQQPEVISSHNLAIGIDPAASFLATTQNWNVGDTLLLSTLRAGGTRDAGEQLFRQSVQELSFATPQQQTDGILRRVLAAPGAQPHRRPLAILSMERVL